MQYEHNFRSSDALSRFETSRDLWDTPLFESQNFVALPTVGALVEGWLLIVPREPLLSFAEVPNAHKKELEGFVWEVASALTEAYGPISLFEHGPSSVGSSVGCGVDYAHLHLVPFCCDLVSGAKIREPLITWRVVTSMTEAWASSQREEYWIVQNEFNKSPCYRGTFNGINPPSQLFRKVIASHLGRPDDFDWKTDLGAANISATFERLMKTPMPA
jgi:diadenosine tetraphosphate (Ap4A) HIT family hydrolase